LADGRVAVPFVTGLAPLDVALHVLFLRPDGTTVVQEVADPAIDNHVAILPYKAVPNGQGGIVVTWDRLRLARNTTNDLFSEARVSALAADGTYLGGINLVILGVESNGHQNGSWWNGDRFGDLVLGDQGTLIATSYSLGDGPSGPVPQRLNVVQPLSSNGFGGSFGELVDTEASSVIAGANGTFVLSLSDGSISGPDPAFAQMQLARAQYGGSGTWYGTESGSLVNMAGPLFLPNATGWSENLGLNAANAASPVCGDPDLNSLVSEYPFVKGVNSAGQSVTIKPRCSDFSRNGSGSVHFLWEELNGHVIFDANGNRRPSDNNHDWAIVKDSLRAGVDMVYEAVGGIRLAATYRSPNVNAKIPKSAKSSAHIWGVGADMKPADAPAGPMLAAAWLTFRDIVRRGGAVWTEPYEISKDHVHGSFEWWPGRPEYRPPQ
jgi:hypothetical protein